MAILKMNNTNVGSKKVNLEIVRPDIRKIKSNKGAIATAAVQELTSVMSKLDEQHMENQKIKINNDLNDIDHEISTYQKMNPEMYMSKEGREKHEKVIEEMLRKGNDKIKDNKSLGSIYKEKRIEEYKNKNELSYGDRDVRSLEAYKARTVADSTTEALRLTKKAKSMILTQDNIDDYNETNENSANLIYRAYEAQGDGKAARPIIENTTYELMVADVQNDLTAITDVVITNPDDWTIIEESIETRMNENHNEIIGRVDAMFGYKAYKDMKPEEVKKYKEQLVTRFEADSLKKLTAAKMDAMQKHNNAKIKLAEDTFAASQKSYEEYSKTSQKVYNLNNTGDLINANFEATGNPTTGLTLINLDKESYNDKKSMAERMQPGDKSYIPQIENIAGLKKAAEESEKEGYLKKSFFSNNIKPLFEGKTNAEKEMIIRQLDKENIIKKSFVKVCMDKNMDEEIQIDLIKKMEGIISGKKLTGNLMLSQVGLDGNVIATKMFENIMANKTQSLRFVAMLKAKSMDGTNEGNIIAGTIDFTSPKSVTDGAARYFKGRKNDFDKYEKALNIYRSEIYVPATLNYQYLDKNLKTRLGIEIKKTESETADRVNGQYND